MIQECKVILQNDVNTVIQFDNIKVQFPSSKIQSDTVFVKYENGQYSIVSKTDYVKEKNKKSRFKDDINDVVYEAEKD